MMSIISVYADVLYIIVSFAFGLTCGVLLALPRK